MSTLPPSKLPHRNLPVFFLLLYWRQLVLVQKTLHLTYCLLNISHCYFYTKKHLQARPTNPSGFSISLIIQLVVSKFILLRRKINIFNFYLHIPRLPVFVVLDILVCSVKHQTRFLV